VNYAKTTLCERGGFEEHPESHSPRIFASVKSTGRTYELLQTGFFLSWPSLPPADFPEYMHFTIENLHCFSMGCPSCHQPWTEIVRTATATTA
jgi:hypothetical protein